MKKKILLLMASLAFGFANAQLEPKTSQGKSTDTVIVPVARKANDKTVIANKSILKRNTLDAGMGRPDPIKKDIHTNEPVPTPIPAKSRVEAVADTITRKTKP